MKTKEKINVVQNLVKSLDFSNDEKLELIKLLQSGMSGKSAEQTSTESKNEYFDFPLLYKDGSISQCLLIDKQPMAIVLKDDRGKRFGLCVGYTPRDNMSCVEAQHKADSYPLINGNMWRVLTTSECRGIAKQLYAVNCALAKLNCRQIVRSNQIGVLVSDDGMYGAVGWQVWFAIDID